MSPTPIVTDQLNKQNTKMSDPLPASIDGKVRLPMPKDLDSLNLALVTDTHVARSMEAKIPKDQALKNIQAEPTLKDPLAIHGTQLDRDLDIRMKKLRNELEVLRLDAEFVRRTTGALK